MSGWLKRVAPAERPSSLGFMPFLTIWQLNLRERMCGRCNVVLLCGIGVPGKNRGKVKIIWIRQLQLIDFKGYCLRLAHEAGQQAFFPE
jgi:hypothetical protein